jgi:hypothetical protein
LPKIKRKTTPGEGAKARLQGRETRKYPVYPMLTPEEQASPAGMGGRRLNDVTRQQPLYYVDDATRRTRSEPASRETTCTRSSGSA